MLVSPISHMEKNRGAPAEPSAFISRHVNNPIQPKMQMNADDWVQEKPAKKREKKKKPPRREPMESWELIDSCRFD